MARFYLLFFLLLLGLTAVAMISCLSAETGEVRGLPRGLWVLLILLFPLVGPAAYFASGRPVPVGGQPPRIVTPTPKTRPLAPDDDPEFLRRLTGRQTPTERPRPDAQKPDGGPKDGTSKKDGTPKTDTARTDEARSTDDSAPTDG